MHKHSPLLPDVSLALSVRLSAHGDALLAIPLNSSILLFRIFQTLFSDAVWIIQSSTGVESAHKLENTMNDSRMFKLDRAGG